MPLSQQARPLPSTGIRQTLTKLVALSILTALATPSRVSAADPPADLRKYLQPAGITKRDWLLLKAEVESFTIVSSDPWFYILFRNEHLLG
jgi:hypothetical protein